MLAPSRTPALPDSRSRAVANILLEAGSQLPGAAGSPGYSPRGLLTGKGRQPWTKGRHVDTALIEFYLCFKRAVFQLGTWLDMRVGCMAVILEQPVQLGSGLELNLS